MTSRVKTRRYSIPDADDAAILSIFDTAAHYTAEKRSVSVVVEHRPVPSVQTLNGLQRRHPEVDWRASRLISSVSANYGPVRLTFARAPAGLCGELSLVSPESMQATDMVRFVASQPALLQLRQDTLDPAVAGRTERRMLAMRVARVRRLRLRIDTSDVGPFNSAMRKLLPPARIYIPMRGVAWRLRSVPANGTMTLPASRVSRLYVSIVAALLTLLVGVQAISLLAPVLG